MKYKEGDKVRVKTDLIIDEYHGSQKFTKKMSQYKNKIFTIKKVYPNSVAYSVKEATDLWTDEMFEPVFKVGDYVKVKEHNYIKLAIIDEIIENRVILRLLKLSRETFLTVNDTLTCFTDDIILATPEEYEPYIEGPKPDYPKDIAENIVIPYEPYSNKWLKNNHVEIVNDKIKKELEDLMNYTKIDKDFKRTILGVDSAYNPIDSFRYSFINEGEENMKLLEIYEEKMTAKIEAETDKKINELEKNDTVQVIVREMKQQIIDTLGIDETDFFNPKLDYLKEVCHFELYTEETNTQRNNLLKEQREQKEELKSKINEIRAHLEITETYEQKMKVLENYDIIDKKGKLKI